MNNMKLLCFKIFLKDAQSYSKWSKQLDELKAENVAIPEQREQSNSLWFKYLAKFE